MKNLFKTSLILLAMTSLLSCKEDQKVEENAQVSEPAAVTSVSLSFESEKVENQFKHYIHLKKALVDSDASIASVAATKMKEYSSNAELNDLLSEIADSDDLATQRDAFKKMTPEIMELVNASLTSGAVYKQFCPMAFNNEGGYWLSTEKEIRNPYYGDQMLKCGRVVETLEK